MGTKVGNIVGYDLGGKKEVDEKNTKIIFVSERFMINKITKWIDIKNRRRVRGEENPFENVCCIILDEVHERTLLTDICIGALKDIALEIYDLKVILMSATIDTEKFINYYKDTRTDIQYIELEGRMYDVELIYENIVDIEINDKVKQEAIVNTIKKIDKNRTEGIIGY